VILLLPSPDVDESVQMLKDRLHADEPEFNEKALQDIAQINRFFIEHPSNATLATHTFYTKDKSPEQTRAEILSALRHKASENSP
jgi:hypothetical protein